MDNYSRKFSSSAFIKATKDEREALCSQLSTYLTSEMRLGLQTDDSEARRHEVATTLVERLRSWGHDLWNCDEEDEYEIWITDLSTLEHKFGMIVAFHFAERVLVYWRDTTVPNGSPK